jgi:hypothetical protein
MRLRPSVSIIGTVIVIAIVVILGVLIFRPHSNTPSSSETIEAALTDVASSDAVVNFEQDGQTTGDEAHRSIKISVGRDSRTLVIYTGYEGQVISYQTFANNSNAFKAFLAGLQTSGYLLERHSSLDDNYLGQCPLGIRYIFTNINIKNAPDLLWTTSCGLRTGTFGGNFSTVQRLFTNQIPNYSQLVSGVRL